MKKIIALILALIMTFSMGTVAFAQEDTAPADDTSAAAPEEGADEEEAGDFDWLLDLPFWTVKPALKIAKIALKFAKVYVKLGVIFGFVDKDDIIGQIEDLIAGANNGEEAPESSENVEPDGDIAVDDDLVAA